MQTNDRILMGASLVFCALGCLSMVSLTGHVIGFAMYLLGFVLLLAFTNVLEGVSMSLLSKVIHPTLAKGTFNAGALIICWKVALFMPSIELKGVQMKTWQAFLEPVLASQRQDLVCFA